MPLIGGPLGTHGAALGSLMLGTTGSSGISINLPSGLKLDESPTFLVLEGAVSSLSLEDPVRGLVLDQRRSEVELDG